MTIWNVRRSIKILQSHMGIISIDWGTLYVSLYCLQALGP